jgi:signal transduction histidine kinase
LGSITSAGRHLLSLINDVLDLSKIEAGRIEIHSEVFNIGSLLDEAVATTEPLSVTNGNELVVKCDIRSQNMCADLVKFRQCLFNLLSNACKFTRSGTIVLDVHHHSMDDRDWLDWEVRDTGIGIPADQRHKLFAAFSQVDNSATRKHGGTGLGLAISHRLCGLMGGKLLVESELGRGSTFILRMPADLVDMGDQGRDLADGEPPTPIAGTVTARVTTGQLVSIDS